MQVEGALACRSVLGSRALAAVWIDPGVIVRSRSHVQDYVRQSLLVEMR